MRLCRELDRVGERGDREHSRVPRLVRADLLLDALLHRDTCRRFMRRADDLVRASGPGVPLHRVQEDRAEAPAVIDCALGLALSSHVRKASLSVSGTAYYEDAIVLRLAFYVKYQFFKV